ncbi:hypothetical protein [Muricoccus radiodurans]|uniref:hypothetical protein n=1 Tax=Muricoccus radiodurans TaxID=2231721 RepID=UPI003CE6C661
MAEEKAQAGAAAADDSSVAAILKAALGALTADAVGKLKDSREVKGDSIEGTVLAYRSLGAVAQHISQKIKERIQTKSDEKTEGKSVPETPGVMLQTSDEIPSFSAHRNVDAAIKLVEDNLNGAVEAASGVLDPIVDAHLKSFAGAAGLAGAAVSAALAVGTLFRTETKITHSVVNPDAAALVAAVAGKLRALITPECTVLTTTSLAVRAMNATESPLLKRLAALHAVENKASGLMARLDRRLAEKAPDTPKEDAQVAAGGPPQSLDAKKEPLIATRARLADAIKDYATLLDKLGSAPANAGDAVLLSRALEGETLWEALGVGGLIVALKVLGGGGTSIVEERIGPDLVIHRGGAIASFVIIRRDGTLEDAGICIKQSSHEGGWESKGDLSV